MRHCYSIKWLPGLCALLVIALVAFPSGVDAQSTVGKVSGRVTDSATGEALPGANVVLEGTRLGGTAGVNGDYFILQVPPGIYNVQASLVGYRSLNKTGVDVLLDRTATVDFELGQTDAQLDELVVTADLDPVQMDVSFAQQALTQEQIEAIPVGGRIRDQVASQVGINNDAWGITIRGEESTTLSYSMDGVSANDNRQQRAYTSYSKTAIKQVQILSGGFNAEHGNVRGGVVNFVTKEPNNFFISSEATYSGPGKKHFGPNLYSEDNWWDVGRFQSDSPTADRNGDGDPDFIGWTQELANRTAGDKTWNAGTPGSDQITTVAQARGIWEWQHRRYDWEDPFAEGGQFNTNPENRGSDYMWDGTIGGPILGDKVGFTFSSRKERMAYAFENSLPSYRDNTTQVKLTFRPFASTKLQVSYIRGWQEGGHISNNVGVPFRSVQASFENYSHGNTWMPSSTFQKMEITRNHALINWSHTLSPKTFYNVTARFGNADWNAKWHPAMNSAAPAVAIGTSGARTPVSFGAAAAAASASGAVVLNEAPFGWIYKSYSKDILGIYNMQGGGGNSRAGDWSTISENDFTFDITSQVTPNHQMKAGVQIHHFDLHENRGYVPAAVPEFADPIYKDEYEGPRISSTGNETYPWIPEVEVPTGGATGDHNNYEVKTPIYGGVFFQDRMEYRSIVANTGFRLDWNRPDLFFDLPNETHFPWFGRRAEQVYAAARKVRPPTDYAFSPRFGVSYPITTLSKMFLNYGHFNQLVNTRDMYRTQSGLGQSLEFLGNPWMSMERTIQYEMGYERSFQGTYLLAGTVYFKDLENEAWSDSRTRGADNDGGPRLTQNAFAMDARGIELKLQKARGKFFTGFLSYDIRVARVRNAGWRQIYDVKTVSDVNLSVLADNPNNAAPPFKAKPQIKLGGNWRTPLDYGGDQALLKGGWNLGFFFEREAGDYFNYNPGNADASLINKLNAQWKDSYTGHIRLAKMFDVQGSPMLFMEISNPLNFKNTHTTPGGGRQPYFGVDPEDTPRNGVGSFGGGGAFEYAGTNTGNRYKAYMESIGWTLDSSGNLNEGKRPGTDVEDFPDMRRPYFLYSNPRDFTFGARFSF
jgi:hypothetical protein